MKYYKVLGVDINANQDDIKRAYRKLSFEKHPDKNKNSETTKEYQEINEAYAVLSDVEKRNMYDMQQNGFVNFDDTHKFDDQLTNLFSDLLSDAINKGVKKGKGNAIDGFASLFGMPSEDNISPLDPSIFLHHPQNHLINQFGVGVNKPENIEIEQTITYEQSYSGCCIPIIIDREIIRSTSKKYEKETIYIDVKKGVDDNEIITIKDKGNIWDNTYSDVKIKILLENSRKFERHGINLVLFKKITFKESLCGFKFDINHLNGNTISFSSSRGNIIQNGDTKSIKNLGFSRDDVQGDLILTFQVLQPETLNNNQLKVIENIFS